MRIVRATLLDDRQAVRPYPGGDHRPLRPRRQRRQQQKTASFGRVSNCRVEGRHFQCSATTLSLEGISRPDLPCDQRRVVARDSVVNRAVAARRRQPRYESGILNVYRQRNSRPYVLLHLFLTPLLNFLLMDPTSSVSVFTHSLTLFTASFRAPFPSLVRGFLYLTAETPWSSGVRHDHARPHAT